MNKKAIHTEYVIQKHEIKHNNIQFHYKHIHNQIKFDQDQLDMVNNLCSFDSQRHDLYICI